MPQSPPELSVPSSDPIDLDEPCSPGRRRLLAAMGGGWAAGLMGSTGSDDTLLGLAEIEAYNSFRAHARTETIFVSPGGSGDFTTITDALASLSERRLHSPVSIELTEGVFPNHPPITIEHPDAHMISISGNEKGGTIIRFRFQHQDADPGGYVQEQGGIKIDGLLQLGELRDLVLDGSDNPIQDDLRLRKSHDPMGIRITHGGSIRRIHKVTIRAFPRNGLFVWGSASCFARHLDVRECGSDGVVSTNSAFVLADGATVDGCAGAGFFVNQGAVLRVANSVAKNIIKREQQRGGEPISVGGDGYISVDGGQMIANKAHAEGCDGNAFIAAIHGDMDARSSVAIDCHHGFVIERQARLRGAGIQAKKEIDGVGVWVREGGEFLALQRERLTSEGLHIKAHSHALLVDGGRAIVDDARGSLIQAGARNDPRSAVFVRASSDVKLEGVSLSSETGSGFAAQFSRVRLVDVECEWANIFDGSQVWIEGDSALGGRSADATSMFIDG